jgi:hypothetical protein
METQNEKLAGLEKCLLRFQVEGLRDLIRSSSKKALCSRCLLRQLSIPFEYLREREIVNQKNIYVILLIQGNGGSVKSYHSATNFPSKYSINYLFILTFYKLMAYVSFVLAFFKISLSSKDFILRWTKRLQIISGCWHFPITISDWHSPHPHWSEITVFIYF